MKYINTFLLVISLFSCVTTFGAEIPWSTSVSGTSIPGAMLVAQDPDFASLGSGGFTDVKAYSYVRLGLTESAAMDYFGSDKEIKVTVKITKYSDAGVAQTPAITTSLAVYYDYNGNNGVTVDGEDYRIDDVHKIKIEVIDVYVNNVLNATLPNYVYLEGGFYAERYYDMDITTLPGISSEMIEYNSSGGIVTPGCATATTTCTSTDEIFLTWDYVAGAEYYELEWSWVDNYHPTSLGSSLATSGVDLTENDFKRNCTRIRTSDQFFRIPQIFDKGYLIIRVRGVGRWDDDTDKELFGKWSSYTAATKEYVSDWPFVITIDHAHERTKNWQYQATYAEEGKKKEVTQYFDGSLRGRQTVTRINSDNQSIVGETIYDNEGRGVIQILPVPQANPAIQYYSHVNLSSSSTPYSHHNFDWESETTTTCGAALADPLDSLTSGAGEYYSTGAHSSEADWQQYVPDADGYAYTQIEYTPDNTGRIRNQSGVGRDHAIGSGHETYYYYTQPAQEELNRLFGYKVGIKKRYKKNIIVDANGQASISYLDAQGRVIATALAGHSPEVFDSISNIPAANHYSVTYDLLNKVLDTDTDTELDDNDKFSTGTFGANNDGLELKTQLGVPLDNTYSFDYEVTSTYYSETCDGTQGVQYPYVYDLKLSLIDDCGVQQFSQTYDSVIGNQAFGSTATDNVQIAINNVNLEPGTYTLHKELTVNEEVLQNYLENYLNDANSCLLDSAAFFADSSFDCGTSCDECVDALGTLQEFLDEKEVDEGATLTSAQTTAYTNMYNQLVDDCEAPCRKLSSCDVYRTTMLGDVSPGGQYGTGTSDALSVFNTSNSLGTNKDWKHPNTPYADAYGNAAQITAYDNGAGLYYLTDQTTNGTATPEQIDPEDLQDVTEFISIFQPSWAESLLPFHPEYALLEYQDEICTETADVTVSGGTIPLTSEEFDAILRDEILTFAEAENTGTGNDYGINFIDGTSTPGDYEHIYIRDPYFNITYTNHSYSYPSVPNFTALKNNLMLEALNDFRGSGYNMLEYSYMSVEQGNTYTTLTPTNWDTWDEIENLSTTTTEDMDAIWQAYKAYYLSTKAQINQYLMDIYGFNEADGMFNGCIGEGSMNFGGVSHFEYSTTYYSTMVGHIVDAWKRGSTVMYQNYPPLEPTIGTSLCSPLYNDKQMRIVRTDYLYDPALDDDIVIEELEAEADYAMWEETGLCPTALDLYHFLKAVAVEGQLKATDKGNEDFVQFTANLFTLINGTAPGAGSTMDFVGTVNGNTLEYEFNGNSAKTLYIDNPVNNNGTLYWSNYTSSWDIYDMYGMYPNGTNYDFDIIILAGATEASAQEYVITVENNFIDIEACESEYDPPTNPIDVSCDQRKIPIFEGAMLNMMQQLLYEGEFNNTTGYNITSKDYYANTILPESIGEPTTATWIYDGTYNRYMMGGSGTDSMSITLTSSLPDPASVTFNIVSVGFTDGNLNNTVYIEYVQDDGTVGSVHGSYDFNIDNVGTEDFQFECPCNDTINETNEEVLAQLEVFFNDILMDNTPPASQPASYVALDQFSTFSLTTLNISGFDVTTDNNGELYFLFGTNTVSLTNQGTTNSADLEYVSNLSYSSTDGFTCLGHFDDGSEDMLDGTLNGLVNFSSIVLDCPDCSPILVAPLSCNNAYDTLTSDLSSVLHATAMSESDFCDGGYKNIVNAYDDYLDDLGITNTVNSLFLTIAEFGATGIGYNDTELALAVDAYAASVYSDTTEAYFMTWNEYVGSVYLAVNDVCPVAIPTSFPAFPSNAEEEPCDLWENNVITTNGYTQYENYLAEMGDLFIQSYLEGALSSVVETFEETHYDKEYHYTLYYYDRAGNLIQTVPPKGVDRFEASEMTNNDVYSHDEINALRVNDPNETIKQNTTTSEYMAPNHTYNTNYRYNSLNQLVYQSTPDGGISRFAYDALGRLVMSQNAVQAGSDQFSYTKYDALGRVVEVGEMTLTGYSINSIGRLIDGSSIEADEVNQSSFPGNLSTDREEITYSIYDDLSSQKVPKNGTNVYATTLFDSYASDNTRNRIVGVLYQDTLNAATDSIYTSASFYDYDVHGNVKQLIQVNNNSFLLANNQNIKKLNYEYDLVSGNVHTVTFQKDREDQFMHRYNYDDDNRITFVETSNDGVVWEKDAKYFYYDHGPLARTEVGDRKVQATDYAYTIQGWIKAVNGEEVDETNMMGQDGKVGTTNNFVGQDAFGFSLSYYDDDYHSANNDFMDYSTNGTTTIGASLYNGNIRAMFTALTDEEENLGVNPLKTHHTNYTYDQLQRIKSMTGYYQSSGSPNESSGYSSSYAFDPNGNLTSLQRYAYHAGTSSSVLMDNFTYNYQETTTVGGTNNNQLSWVNDEANSANGYVSQFDDADIDGSMNSGNYEYDAIGQLVQDLDEDIDTILWTVTNKVKKIIYDSDGDAVADSMVWFDYDPMGNRIAKHWYQGTDTISTFYALDAQGNQMSMYKYSTIPDALKLIEQNVYGSSRLGQEQSDLIMSDEAFTYFGVIDHEIGDKRYQLSNHLGNVLEVITDRKLPMDLGSDGDVDYFTADVVSFSDYYPYGMIMPNRSYSSGSYCYGFQDQEVDDEIKGTGNSVNYKFRMHDPRVGRFFAVDPLAPDYPFNSPYTFSQNVVINGIELEGLEYRISVITYPGEKPYLEVVRDDDIPLGYYELVYVRKGATAVGEEEVGGSDTRSTRRQFQTKDVVVPFFLAGNATGEANDGVGTSIYSNETMIDVERVLELVKEEANTQLEGIEGVVDNLPKTKTGTSRNEQTIGGNLATNPATFIIRAKGIVNISYNPEINYESSRIEILAKDIGTDFVTKLADDLRAQGYDVVLTQDDNLDGDLDVADPDNPSGITIHMNLDIDLGRTLDKEPVEIISVEDK